MKVEIYYGYDQNKKPRIIIGMDIFEGSCGEIQWDFEYLEFWNNEISCEEVVDELGGDPEDSVDEAYEKFKEQFSSEDAVNILKGRRYEFSNESHPSLTASERN